MNAIVMPQIHLISSQHITIIYCKHQTHECKIILQILSNYWTLVQKYKFQIVALHMLILI